MGLFPFSFFVMLMTGLLILAGGLVTSHKAGLAVPDWPLSYGRFFPPMVGNIFWEHGHRMMAGSVGILTLLLALWIQIQEKRAWLKRLAWISFGAVVFQAVLGGLTVLYMLPAPISIFHACLAQTFFCLIVAITFFLRPQSASFVIPASGSPARLFLITTCFIYLQLILGATVRHTAQGHALVPHIVVAFLVAIHVILCLVRSLRFHGNDQVLSRAALSMGMLTVFQIFLGMGSFIFTRMIPQGDVPSALQVLFTAFHQTGGAMILAISVFMNLWVRQ